MDITPCADYCNAWHALSLPCLLNLLYINKCFLETWISLHQAQSSGHYLCLQRHPVSKQRGHTTASHHRVEACFREMFEISQPLFFPLFSLSHQARRGENQLIPNLTTQFYQRRFSSYYHVILTDMATSSISSLLMTPSPSRSYRWKVHSSFSSGLPFTSTDSPNTKSCTAQRH